MKFKQYLISEEQINQEMIDWFWERTLKHINLVKKYGLLINDKLEQQIELHDNSKFNYPEYEPYILLTWEYKCKDKGIDFKINEEQRNQINKATEHHIKNNRHHPEYWCEEETNLINNKNRDEVPDKIIDSTKMPDQYILEMVSDWCSMSEEKGTDPNNWASKNINKRWKFTDSQENLIYETIENCWNKT